MKTDNYTRFILTIIALCLMVIIFRDIEIVPRAYANEPANLHQNTVNYGLVPLNKDGSINVHVTSVSADMDVNIAGIKTTDKLSVNLEEVDNWAFNRCIVPVKIQKE